MRRVRDYLEFAGVKLIDFLLSFLSWRSAQEVGARLGRAARHLAPKRWSMTLRNLEHAFPEWSAARRETVALEAWGNAGRIAAELVRSRSLSKAELEEIVIFEQAETVDALIAEGRGVIFNIGHLGNWEVGGVAFTARGWKLGVVGRVMKNPFLEAWIRETRGRFGETVFAHRNPFFSLVKWLKSGKLTAILIDHNLYQGGIFVPFFGRPAATSTLGGLLSAKLECPIVSVRVYRDGHRLRVRFEGPLRPDPEANPEREAERLTVEMTKILEGYIRERPGEWLWGHNRWKRAHEAALTRADKK